MVDFRSYAQEKKHESLACSPGILMLPVTLTAQQPTLEQLRAELAKMKEQAARIEALLQRLEHERAAAPRWMTSGRVSRQLEG